MLGALAAAPVGGALRPLREDLLRDAHARLRHGVLHVRAEVLPAHRRRRGHAVPAPSLLGARPRRDAEDRLPHRAPTTTTRWRCSVLATLVMWRIVRSPFGLCLQDDPRQSRQGRDARHRRHPLPLRAPSSSPAVYAAVGGALLGPPTGNVDPTLAYWTHSGNLVFMTLLGGFASFFGPVVGAFVFIYLQNCGDVGRPLLASGLRRDPRAHRHLRAGRADGARDPPPAGAGRTRMILRRRRSAKALRRVLRPRRREPHRRPGRVRLDHRPQRRRQVDADQHPHRRDAADRGQRALQGSRGRRHRAGTPGAPRHGPLRSSSCRSFPTSRCWRRCRPRSSRASDAGRRLFASLAGDREVQAGALEVAELFGLAERRHVPARQLPQGDKKLLDVASAFALRPEIILLDEPTSGVSTADKTAIMETLVTASKQHRAPGHHPGRARHGHRLRVLGPHHRAPPGPGAGRRRAGRDPVPISG